MHYILELGRNIELSVAEIISVYGAECLVSIHSEYLVIETDENVDIDKLGGVVSVYKIATEVEGFLEEKDMINFVVNNLESKHIGIESNFLSKSIIDNVLKRSKGVLKSKGKSVRFLMNTKTATILGSGFLKGKVEVYGFFRFAGKVFVAALEGVQNIDAYSGRDFKKPYRDAKLGMLPPKLARTMINLAGEGKVYDPFCGTGTVLMEALVDKRQVLGSDIQQQNIFGTKENLDWLESRFGTNNSDAEVFVADARKISRSDFDVVVTEGYLGKPKKGNESLIELRDEMQEIEDLYVDFLESLKNAVEKEVIVVVSVPVFVSNTKRIYCENLVEKLNSLGYSVSALIPNGNKLELEAQDSFLYKRKDQKVFRQIFRLTYIPR
jgi:tRNA G10  N-methylase Trm11